MKALVVYYSRTGTTEKVAYEIAKKLNADIEKLTDNMKRSGIIGWLRCGRQAIKKELTELNPLKNDPAEYDLVVIGTPKWAGGITPHVRTYLSKNAKVIRKAAFFVTSGGGEYAKLFVDMSKLASVESVPNLGLTSKVVKRGDISVHVSKFIEELTSDA